MNPGSVEAGAVNTIAIEDGRTLGYNTDGLGLVRDLTSNLSLDLAGSRVLLVGAGGAASGVVHPLLNAGIGELTITNRSASRAIELIDEL